MAVNWGDIYETIYMSRADTLIANAFREAVGLPHRTAHGCEVVEPRKSVYAGIDWEKLMGQRYGVRL